MPQRVQLRRTKGWRKPPGVICCARPGRWGNPFYITPQRDRETCVALFRNTMQGVWNPAVVARLSEACRLETYRIHVAWLRRFPLQIPIAYAVAELRGRDLGCWCGPDDPCHVDVLIEAVNG